MSKRNEEIITPERFFWGLLTIIILMLIIFSWIYYTNKVNFLNNQVSTLQNSNKQFQTKYNSLQNKYSSLKNKYNTLQSKNSNYNKTQTYTYNNSEQNNQISLKEQCINNNEVWCNNKCYNPNQCSNGDELFCNYGKAICLPKQPTSSNFKLYFNTEPYYSTYCKDINPYDINIRKASAEAIKNNSGEYSIEQLLDIYDWVKKNIEYQNVPLAGIPYPPSETLNTKTGDCKNQAVLIASMVEAIGGTAKVVVNPSCEHAYTLVYFTNKSADMDSYIKTIENHYNQHLDIHWQTFEGGNWMIFDPAGGYYPGSTLPSCMQNETSEYLIDSCVNYN